MDSQATVIAVRGVAQVEAAAVLSQVQVLAAMAVTQVGTDVVVVVVATLRPHQVMVGMVVVGTH